MALRQMHKDPEFTRQIRAEAIGRVALISTETQDGFQGIKNVWDTFRGICMKRDHQLTIYTAAAYGDAKTEVNLPVGSQLIEQVIPVQVFEFWTTQKKSRALQLPKRRVTSKQALQDDVPVVAPVALQDVGADAAPPVALQDVPAAEDDQVVSDAGGQVSDHSEGSWVESLANGFGIGSSDEGDPDVEPDIDVEVGNDHVDDDANGNLEANAAKPVPMHC